MVRILDKFNLKKSPYVRADGVNYEGFPTFRRSDEEAYLQVLLTNTLTGTFYASENTLLQESLALHQKMASGDPEFMARALVYARNEGLMRLQPIVGLAFLAKAERTLFRKIFPDVVRTPGDLTDFVEIVRGGVTPGGMGRSIKSVVNAWLNGISEYHAIKYGSGGQGYSLRDVLRVAHPKPVDAQRDAIFIWLTDREKWGVDSEKRVLTPQIDAFEQIKALDLTQPGGHAAVRELIARGKLPYEVVTGVVKPDFETWVELMKQMPYMALMRHLNTLQRAEVLRVRENARYVADRLSDPKAVERARILPFRLFTAHSMFASQHPSEQIVADALIDALELAFVNMPELGGKVCIAPDVSGSMSGSIGGRTKVRFQDIAGIFSAALIKASPNALVLPFETAVVDAKFSARDSLMANADKITRLGGGGTAVSAPISELLKRRIAVDTFIGITDNVEWAVDQYGGVGFLPVWNEYKDRVAPDAQAFLITIAPYRMAVAPEDAADIHYIYGWNDNVLSYISMNVAGLEGQVAQVRSIEV